MTKTESIETREDDKFSSIEKKLVNYDGFNSSDFSLSVSYLKDFTDISNPLEQKLTYEQEVELKAKSKEITKKHGMNGDIHFMKEDVERELKNFDGEISLIPSYEKIKDQLNMVDLELSKYPEGFVRASGCNNIIMTGGSNTHHGPTSSGISSSSGFYFHGDSFVLSYYFSDYDKDFSDYDNNVLHHEFFHLLDHKLDKTRSHGDNSARKKLGNETLTDYGKTTLNEDQAEFGCYMMTDIDMVFERALRSEGLLMKLEVMTGCKVNTDTKTFEDYSPVEFRQKYKEFGFNQFEYYKKRSKGTMDASYWNGLLLPQRSQRLLQEELQRKRDLNLEKKELIAEGRKDFLNSFYSEFSIINDKYENYSATIINQVLSNILEKHTFKLSDGTDFTPDDYLGDRIMSMHVIQSIYELENFGLLEGIKIDKKFPKFQQELQKVIGERDMFYKRSSPPEKHNFDINYSAKLTSTPIGPFSAYTLYDKVDSDFCKQWREFGEKCYKDGSLLIVLPKTKRFFNDLRSDLIEKAEKIYPKSPKEKKWWTWKKEPSALYKRKSNYMMLEFEKILLKLKNVTGNSNKVYEFNRIVNDLIGCMGFVDNYDIKDYSYVQYLLYSPNSEGIKSFQRILFGLKEVVIRKYRDEYSQSNIKKKNGLQLLVYELDNYINYENSKLSYTDEGVLSDLSLLLAYIKNNYESSRLTVPSPK